MIMDENMTLPNESKVSYAFRVVYELRVAQHFLCNISCTKVVYRGFGVSTIVDAHLVCPKPSAITVFIL